MTHQPHQFTETPSDRPSDVSPSQVVQPSRPSAITISVHPDRPVKRQGDLFGLFFEDLNHAADGGLYAELVRNRSFEFDPVDNKDYTALTAWESVARGDSHTMVHVDTVDPLNPHNMHYAHIDVSTPGEGGGLRNQGFGDGIAVERGRRYRFSCYARLRFPSVDSAMLTVRLESEDAHAVHASHAFMLRPDEERHDTAAPDMEPIANASGNPWTDMPGFGRWQRIEFTLTADATDHRARLAVLSETPVSFDLDMVSLFPEHTFKGRSNGLRNDLATMLADMKPRFLRFPGGCVMHIGSLDPRSRDGIYRWKNTVGPVEERETRRNSWNYNSTFGLGYFEFFQFCEDIGAEPMPVIAGGWDPHNLLAAPIDCMGEWVDEALDLIEFANGAADSRWGRIRADMGHPEPFGLKYLAIGNEETGEEFFDRYEIIAKAVRERYPDICLIGSAGPTVGGPEADRHWRQGTETGTAYMDEHYYQCPDWFIANVDRYADYDATPGVPKAFLGEYASCGRAWRNALAEAAFLTGVERAPGIGLACYAPMLCHVDYANWDPDMIYFDNHRVYGTPSYYVQKLFMNGQGDVLVESEDDMPAPVPVLPHLGGMLRMSTGGSHVAIGGFAVTDGAGKSRTQDSTFELDADHPLHWCGRVDGESYEVTFTFTRLDGTLTNSLNGRNGFSLDFAMRDEENLLRFSINGWQRLHGLGGITHGEPCTMQNTHLVTEIGVPYHCRLRVDGARARGWIDDTEIFDYTVKKADPRPLYYSTVRDDSGEIIIKLVNVGDDAKSVTVSTAQRIGAVAGSEACIEFIDGVGPDTTNDFDHPERVVPQRRLVPVVDGAVTIDMGPHSLYVVRV